MKRFLSVLSAAIVLLFTQCETIQKLPTNTSGGLFSLNGQWQLTSSSDSKNLEGMVVSVIPGFAEATVQNLPVNNASCVREKDAYWRSVKSDQNGGFLADLLVSACTGSPAYKPATIAVISNNEVRIKTVSPANTEVLQTWTRVTAK
ncbi:MAG: hypothetical protein EON98_08750 [Chitinophagaceae bacterium]|nr:MAG: hypothetical protein EON98_08750 [Chitinophagaceae bacterium]